MSVSLHENPGLRRAILSIVRGTQTPGEIDELIRTALWLAKARLRLRVSKGFLHLSGSTSIEDLAFDCIADLFYRDTSGNLVRFSTYFQGLGLEPAGDEEYLVHLRRLVFSSINQNLFRIYNELDPSLGKIIRNIKLAVQAVQNVELLERFGEQCMAPILCDRLEGLPVADRETLEARIAERVRLDQNIPALVSILSRYLRDQSEHSRIVPIGLAALVFRSIYALGGESSPDRITDHPPELSIDVDSAITWACHRARRHIENAYLSKGRLDRDLSEQYLSIVEMYLRQKLDGVAGGRESLFRTALSVFPAMGKQEYTKKHRSRLEYLARSALKDAVQRLKND